jgi:peroxin-5
MSFLGGPECSTASNPLSQFQKHTQGDNALQRDRLVNSGPGAVGGFRSTAAPGAHDQAMNGFLGGGPGLQNNMGPMLINPSVDAQMRAGAPPQANWAQDFRVAGQMPMNPAFKPPGAAPFSSDEFAKFHAAQHGPASSSQMQHALPSTAASAHMQQMNRPMMGMNMGMISPGMGFGAMNQHPMYQPAQYQQPQPQQAEDKGKGKEVVELDDHKWEEQFAELELLEKEVQKESGVDLDQSDKAMQAETSAAGDFESIWKGIQAEAAANKEFDLAGLDGDWQAQFPEFSDVGRFNDVGRFSETWVDNYTFESDNIFANSKNAYDEGVKIMKEGGNLSLAALAFEAAVQQNPNHVEAWVNLGSAQAQNEKETAAIRAHEHALKLDPANATALMGLAVSYTNEGYEAKAYRSLERWLAAKYPQVTSPASLSAPADLGYTDRAELHSGVTDSFIRAAQLSPDGEHMDPDVQVGLGVLFYGVEQFDKAIDCFQSALASSQMGTVNQRDQVHLLWNRLGATLANSGRPEEAVAAYQHALSINPNFVRARYNLGVSCININCYEEAASHLLAALDLHKSIAKSARSRAYEILGGGGGEASGNIDAQLDRMMAMNMSTTLYDTLRRVFNLMGRPDLTSKVVAGVDPAVFKGEFDF